MDRDRVAAELPASVVAWLDAYGASEGTWTALARDRAVVIGRRLLSSDGEGGWDGEVRRILLDDASPAVRAIVPLLPVGARRWTARDIARAVCSYLDLAGADALRRVLRVPPLVTQQPD